MAARDDARRPGRRRGVRRPRAARSRSSSANGHTPGLGTILVGDDDAERALRRHEAWRRRAELGLRVARTSTCPTTRRQADVLAAIRAFNDDPPSTAMLVQHPTPPQIDFDAALLAIDPDKDVDGMHPVNMGRLALGRCPGRCRARPRASRRCSRTTRSRSPGHEVVHPRARHHARPAARAAALAEAPDRQRRGHGRAHRRARLARVHAAGRHRRRRRRRARHPAARAHHAGRGGRRRRRALRGPQAAARRRRARARRSRARSRRASAASGPTTIAMLFRNAVEAAERTAAARRQSRTVERVSLPDPQPVAPRRRCARSAARRSHRPTSAAASAT